MSAELETLKKWLDLAVKATGLNLEVEPDTQGEEWLSVGGSHFVGRDEPAQKWAVGRYVHDYGDRYTPPSMDYCEVSEHWQSAEAAQAVVVLLIMDRIEEAFAVQAEADDHQAVRDEPYFPDHPLTDEEFAAATTEDLTR